jgi:Plasmid pRiA4b ORF-3-like protein
MVYKIRVILLNSKEEVFRDIEIKDKQNLWNMHLAIKSAFSLPGEELSEFICSDDDWTEGGSIPLEDMSDEGDGEIMSDIYLHEAYGFDGAKKLYKYGGMELWEFATERLNATDEKPAVNYPITVFRLGNAPLKAPNHGVANNKKNQNIFLDDDFNDDFGSDYEDGYDDDDSFDDEEEGGYFDDKLSDDDQD